MLCRVPKIRRILNSPGNMNHRGVILSSIWLQKPFLEERVHESKDKSLMGLVQRNIFAISAEGKIDGRKIPVSRWPLLPSFPKFCEDVAREWDRIKAGDVKELGIPYPWCAPLSPESKFFSNTSRHSGNHELTIHRRVSEISVALSLMQTLEGFFCDGTYPEKAVRAAMAEVDAKLKANMRLLLIKMSLGFNEQIWVEAKPLV
jgi:hypothetical protein